MKMDKNKQINEGGKEKNGWFVVKKSTKRIWMVGIVIILIGVLLVLVSPPPSCDGRDCTVIKGGVLEEGVLTMSGHGGWIETDNACNKTKDCPCKELINNYMFTNDTLYSLNFNFV